MRSDIRTCMLTSNLGSAGEDTTGQILGKWATDVSEMVSSQDIKVMTIHMQELGGKAFCSNFNASLAKVMKATFSEDTFWHSGVMAHLINDKQFTAVGAYVLVSRDALEQVKMFDATEDAFVPISVVSQAIENVHYANTKFSDAGPSRKGAVVYDLEVGGERSTYVAVHLYHDDDNMITVGSKNGSSCVALRRRRALIEALSGKIRSENVILAGDMNFRLDGAKFIEAISKRLPGATPIIERKSFTWGASQASADTAYRSNWSDFSDACREGGMSCHHISSNLERSFSELPITFSPTYPLNRTPEDLNSSLSDSSECSSSTPLYYSTKRLPAWTDRIFFTNPNLNPIKYKSAVSSLDHALVYMTWDN